MAYVHAMDYAYGENCKLRRLQQDTIEDARAAIKLRVADDAHKTTTYERTQKLNVARRRVVT